MSDQQTQAHGLRESDNETSSPRSDNHDALCDAPAPYIPIEGEEWRHVPGYPSLQASNLGRVRLKSTQHVLAITTGEYPRVTFTHAGKTRTVETHRLCGLAFFGPIGPGLVVNHKDGDKMNCCVENLEVITHAQNIQEAQRAGLMKSKLKPLDIEPIRRRESLPCRGGERAPAPGSVGVRAVERAAGMEAGQGFLCIPPVPPPRLGFPGGVPSGGLRHSRV